MLTSTLLVILMTIPGLALFYGGLARSKNMLSVLVQVFVIFAFVSVLWALYGYSLAFTGEGQFFGGLDKLFLKGIAPDTLSGPAAHHSGIRVRGLPVHLCRHHRGADRRFVC